MNPPYHLVGYMDPEFSWNQNGCSRNEYPQVIREAIQREIEKERIREEIITSEIVKRRVLEAEVRMELMMDKEMAMRQTVSGFPFPESPIMPSLLVPKAGWSAEERLGMTLEDKEKLKRIENRRLEIKLASEGNKEKERILLLADENISGSKVKDVNPPEAVNIEPLVDVIANKVSKEEWSCALCGIMATSEKDLKEHVLGKKHKSKVAALRAQRAGKNFSIGLFTKKPTKSIHVKEKGVKHKAQSLSAHKVGKAATSKKKYDLPLSQNPKSDNLKKTQADVIRKGHKKENDPRTNGCKFREVMNVRKLGNIELSVDVSANKKSKEWRCELCQVIATSEYDLNEHVLGKKHESKVAALIAQGTGENRSMGLSPKKSIKSIHVEEKGVKHKAQSLSAHKVGKAATSKKKDDLPLSQNPKSERLKETTQADVLRKVHKRENEPRKNGCKFSEVSTNAVKLGFIELPAEVGANKKSKEEWRCELCQVIATSENNLNEHVLGKKHESKVAALIAQGTGENRSMGLSPKKSIKSIHVEEKEGKTTSKKDGLPLSGKTKSEHLKSQVIKKVHKNENDPRKMASKVINAHKVGNIELPDDVIANKKSLEEWSCALCQVSVPCERGLKEHMLGKKHKSKEAALS